ncbi:hypothetical protein JOC70_001956 [Clostridium pascui]|nr:hypothetical protein [Clostridium pascui]
MLSKKIRPKGYPLGLDAYCYPYLPAFAAGIGTIV